MEPAMAPNLRIAGTKAEPVKRNVARRWTPKLAESFTPVSDFFLENYHRLSPPVTSLEAMFIIHLVRHKWDEKPPYPSFRTIAKRMGVTDTSVRNHARSLERGKKYLRREKVVGQPNRFDLQPLFKALEKLIAADEAKDSKPRRKRA